MEGSDSLYTRGFRSVPGRLRLSPLRTPESVELDGERFRGELEPPPYLRWDRFMEELEWRQGEHITLAGGTGSGKTTLARQLLPRRRYVVVFATKKEDPSLYRPLERQGYVMRSTWEPNPDDEPRVIFKPPLIGGVAGKDAQREAFREALIDIFESGRWCVYADEIRYITQFLGLQTEMELLWLQGRSLKVSVVAATQRPVSIPILAFEAQHLFVWRFSEKRDIDTISEFTGTLFPVVRQTIPRLPKHEMLHIRPEYGTASRTQIPPNVATSNTPR
jgi:DNA helicase HerA-like ATPase